MPFSWAYAAPYYQLSGSGRCPGLMWSETSWQLLPSPLCAFFSKLLVLKLQCVSDKAQKTTGWQGEGNEKEEEEWKGGWSQCWADSNLYLRHPLVSLNKPQTFKRGGCQRTSHSELSIPPGWNARLQDVARRKESQKHWRNSSREEAKYTRTLAQPESNPSTATTPKEST